MAIRHPERPPWLKVRFPAGGKYEQLRELMREQGLHTVCEEAHCPNIGECWSRGTATFMILGDVCTRSCGFCAVATGRPGAVDRGEPARVAATIQRMGLRHAVITSVNRDELDNGGADIFAETIRWTRRLSPGTTIEVLIPDFKGDDAALAMVLAAKPEILNHNTETVPRLYREVRPQAVYKRSLDLLRRAKELDPGALTKSGLMIGLPLTSLPLLWLVALSHGATFAGSMSGATLTGTVAQVVVIWVYATLGTRLSPILSLVGALAAFVVTAGVTQTLHPSALVAARYSSNCADSSFNAMSANFHCRP